MKSPRIVPVMLALLVAGCSMAPDHTRPPMPVPETWSPPDIGVTDAGKRLEWRQFFVDSSLGTIIATALANNRDLRTAVWRVEAARSQYHIARADLFPHVEAGVDAARQRLPAALSTTGRTVIDNQYIAVVSASW